MVENNYEKNIQGPFLYKNAPSLDAGFFFSILGSTLLTLFYAWLGFLGLVRTRNEGEAFISELWRKRAWKNVRRLPGPETASLTNSYHQHTDLFGNVSSSLFSRPSSFSTRIFAVSLKKALTPKEVLDNPPCTVSGKTLIYLGGKLTS